jgi:Gene product 88
MYYCSKLLTRNNHKTIKGEKYGYVTYILYMAPHKQNDHGKNLCANASAGCAAACLFKSGFGGMYTTVQRGRINKANWFIEDRKSFMTQLDKEVSNAIKRHMGNKVVFRLNGTSDIPYEDIIVRDGKNIFQLYPKVQFYDYTKNWKRFDKALPKNYHLTFSRSEKNDDKAMELLSRGFNIAVVFNEVPKKFGGYKVVDGDKSDLRFKDGKGVIVGLKYKKLTGKGVDNKAAFKSGFAISL